MIFLNNDVRILINIIKSITQIDFNIVKALFVIAEKQFKSQHPHTAAKYQCILVDLLSCEMQPMIYRKKNHKCVDSYSGFVFGLLCIYFH